MCHAPVCVFTNVLYPSMCVYIPVICWEHGTTVCGLMAGRACLWLAHPSPPRSHPLPLAHTFISEIHDIKVVVKNYLKNQHWILHGRINYETVAISLLYLYSKSCITIMQHKRTKVASMFQNSISWNTKCDNLVGFSKTSHIILGIFNAATKYPMC